MAPEASEPITEEQLTGFKHLKKLLPLFARLHEVGCACDRAGNRKLHFDEYCVLVMLFLFIRSSCRCGPFRRPAG